MKPNEPEFANTVLLLAALADGTSLLRHLPPSTAPMLDALATLGVVCRNDETTRRTDVVGCNGYWPNSEAELHVDESATLPPLLAACALARGQYQLMAVASVETAVRPLVDALRDLGAQIHLGGDDQTLRINVGLGGLGGGTTRLSSADALADVLLAAPYARTDVFIECAAAHANTPAIESLLAAMETFGVSVIRDPAGRFIIPAPQRYRATEYTFGT